MPFLTTALVAGGLAAAGGLGAAALQSNAAGKAASTQSNAALEAAQLQHQDAQAALGFQEQQYNNSQQELAPWLQSGQSGLANLDYLLGIGPQSGTTPTPQGAPGTPARPSAPVQQGFAAQLNGGTAPTRPGAPVINNAVADSRAQMPVLAGGSTANLPNLASVANPSAPGALQPGTVAGPPPSGIQPSSASLVNPGLGAYGSLNQGWDQTFQAPTGLTEQNDPGYEARLNLGEQALNNSAAARGGLLTGGTARDVDQFAQDYASNEYGNVYNRALQTYGTNYNTFEQNQANQYNRLASLAGIGQQTAGQLSTAGQNSANNISNTLLTSGAQTGQQLNNAAAATASGYVGGANAYGGALSGVGGNLGNLATLYGLLNQQQQNQINPNDVPVVSNYGGLLS
jgi:hypothetical protein